MRVGCYSMTLGRDYTVPQVVEMVSRIGYQGVEWRINNDNYHVPLTGLEEKAPELKAQCEKAGLQITALATYLPVEDTQGAEAALRAAAMMGCVGIRVQLPTYHDNDTPFQPLFERARQGFAKLEPVCRRIGVKALMELHMGHIAPSASAAYRVVEGFSPECIGVTFDPGNMVYEGIEDWKMGMQILGPYLAHCHVKNAGWRYSEEEGWKFYTARINKGIIDWAKVIRSLAECGYDGWLSVEDFADVPLEEKLQEDFTLLNQWVRTASMKAEG